MGILGSSESVSGKSILVTGGSGGIGEASALALSAKGANITLVDINKEALAASATKFPEDRVHTVVADVTDFAAMEKAVGSAVEAFGKVDVVFANAGVAQDPPNTFLASDLEKWERVVEIDLYGVARTIKAALPEIVRNKGYVLITASIYAFANGVVNTPYAASKAAVESLGRGLRLELAAHGASAGVLYPGWVSTPIVDATRGGSEWVTKMKDRVFKGPIGKYIEPEQVAAAVVKGVENRSARIIEPKYWAPAAGVRGFLNAGLDAALEKDKGLLDILRNVENESRTKK